MASPEQSSSITPKSPAVAVGMRGYLGHEKRIKGETQFLKERGARVQSINKDGTVNVFLEGGGRAGFSEVVEDVEVSDQPGKLVFMPLPVSKPAPKRGGGANPNVTPGAMPADASALAMIAQRVMAMEDRNASLEARIKELEIRAKVRES